MSEYMDRIAVKDIGYDFDRQAGGMGNIDALANSIEAVGLIEPIVLRKSDEDKPGKFQLVAGRRRLEAVMQLGRDTISAIIRDHDDLQPGAIALAENVNRLEMHPLDEAENFRRLADSGLTIEQIARQYDRSVSAIYHRTRLCLLVDELKDMFRDGKIVLSAASMLSSLNAKQQADFYEQNKKNTNIDTWHVNHFIDLVQKCKLDIVFSDKCAGCKKRTRHTDSQLFDEYKNLDDVCLDEKCFYKKWAEFLDREIDLVREENPGTENRLILWWPITKYFEGMETITLGKTEYQIERKNRTVPAGTPGSFTAWSITTSGESLKIDAVTCSHIKDDDGDGDGDDGPVFNLTGLVEVPPERIPVTETALRRKYKRDWTFKQTVRDTAMQKVIQKKAAQDPDKNSIDRFFKDRRCFGKKEKETLELFTGEKVSSISKAFKKYPAEKIFTALYAANLQSYSMPEVDGLDPDKLKKNDIFKFAGMTADQFTALYQETAGELVDAAIREAEEAGPEQEAVDEYGEEDAVDIDMDDGEEDEDEEQVI